MSRKKAAKLFVRLRLRADFPLKFPLMVKAQLVGKTESANPQSATPNLRITGRSYNSDEPFFQGRAAGSEYPSGNLRISSLPISRATASLPSSLRCIPSGQKNGAVPAAQYVPEAHEIWPALKRISQCAVGVFYALLETGELFGVNKYTSLVLFHIFRNLAIFRPEQWLPDQNEFGPVSMLPILAT